MFNWFKRRRQPQSERSTAGASSELLTTPIAEVRERLEAEARLRQQQAAREAIAEKERLLQRYVERRGSVRAQAERRRTEPAYRRHLDDPIAIPVLDYETGPSKSYSSGGHHHRDETVHTPSDPTPPSDFGGTSYNGE